LTHTSFYYWLTIVNQINVFVLGSTFLKLVQSLNLSDKIPHVDPSLYIQRFASLLEFGDETQKVAADATMLITRFRDDWMVQGRRPAGICGACILLAARMNNFRRSVMEIVQVVKIADVTVRKRLDEFRATASGQLSVQDFRAVASNLTEYSDPPAFTASLKRARREKEEREREKESKRQRLEEGADDKAIGIAVDGDEGEADGTEDALTAEEKEKLSRFEHDVVDPEIESDVGRFLHSKIGAEVTKELEEREKMAAEEAERKKIQELDEGEANRLDNLDEEELDGLLMSEGEIEDKTILWMNYNRDFLERVAGACCTSSGIIPVSLLLLLVTLYFDHHLLTVWNKAKKLKEESGEAPRPRKRNVGFSPSIPFLTSKRPYGGLFRLSPFFSEKAREEGSSRFE
jgi:transcription factor IIIB 90 kDa subunit